MNKNYLTKYLRDNKVLKTKNIINAFEKIDRKNFVLEKYLNEAYDDYPLPIGYGQTISQPTTVAFMTELLQPKTGDKVLDIGTGSGWTTALLAHIVSQQSKSQDTRNKIQKNGKVIGLEIIPELVRFGQKNLKKYGFNNAEIHQANPKIIGDQKNAPFDKILVSASAQEIQKELINQLKTGGILVMPVQNSILKIKKLDQKQYSTHEFPGFVFVPLK